MSQAKLAMTITRRDCKFIPMKETVGDRLSKLRERRGLSQTEVAKRLSITPQSVQQWESNKTLPRGKRLGELSLLYGCSQGYILAGDGDPTTGSGESSEKAELLRFDAWDSSTPLHDDEVEVPLFREVLLAAGHGSTEVVENHGAKLRFAKSTLAKQNVDASSAACCFVTGDSMEPILPDGSTVGVDTSKTQIVDGKMYAIDNGGLLRVKYLYRLPGGGVRIRSANRDEYPDEDLTIDQLEHFRVIGRVFWYSVLL